MVSLAVEDNTPSSWAAYFCTGDVISDLEAQPDTIISTFESAKRH